MSNHLKTAQVLRSLRDYESRNVTFIEEDGSWPIVWERARWCQVWDVEGKQYLDLTAAFGVAAAGHANPRVVAAARKQMSRLLHAMGDVHPHAGKARLARELSRVTFERWTKSAVRGKTVFCNSGFEAVECALKTAVLATGRPGVVAFEGGYHGLGYGALTATHRAHFRRPFKSQLRQFVRFVPFPETEDDLAVTEKSLTVILKRHRIGAVLVEPVQARAGIRIPPMQFLKRLRKLCDASGALLIVDEIYTGFGRTGKWFACELSETIPDLICLGKALTGGFPLSACVGKADLMDRAWPPSSGEAIHTSTFLGHPVGCAMALAQIKELHGLIGRSARRGIFLLKEIQKTCAAPHGCRMEIRGLGLMAGIEVWQKDGRPATALVLRVIKKLLRAGFIVLPEGRHSNVIAVTPPFIISERELRRAVKALVEILATEKP